ncbi:metallophosphoesterase [uncultured Lactobacillus sp.]|uniref:metallophosphoesterase family protein n=1 Tax=uncultured Lactobacillus sp. TaxID=153152 RepID=UPI002804FE60|nr:metallophosphoesterase [uncultured Lactobacillus sp.]
MTQIHKIYLLSDTHLIADSLHDQGAAFQKMQLTSAGKDLNHQEIMLSAFVRKILNDKPDAVVITGDLTFNGEKVSAERLKEIFHPLQKAKIDFFPLPGNHDIYDGWARKFDRAYQYLTPQISPYDFKSIFRDAYDKAVSCDPSSLAYSINFKQKYRLIFADSNIYGNQNSNSHPITNGFIKKEQLKWIEQQLKVAQQSNQYVLFFMHHSLNNHNNIVNGGFTLDNAQELKQLFTKYNVKVSFTGHIHAQNIASSASGVDIASSCFSMCDQGYGIITLADNKLEYHRFSFDPIPYLTDEEKRLLPTGDYHDYLKKLFIQTNEIQMQNFKKRFPSENDFDTVMNLINQLNYNFFIGKSNYSSAQKKEIESSISYQLVQKFLPEMKKYVDSLLAIKQNSQHVFITL